MNAVERPRWPWPRLHQLTGVVPLAGYLVLHLGAQAFAFGGEQGYRRMAGALDRLPWLGVLELGFVVLPLSVHVLIGLVWLLPRAAGRARALSATHRAEGLLLQSVTGVLVLTFLLGHLWQFRGQLWLGDIDRRDFFAELCASLSATAFGGFPVVAVFYLIGVAAAAVHCAHGLYRAGRPWARSSRGRQRALGQSCVLLGVGLFLLGSLLVIELATGSAVIQLPGS
jgi:succinate dehydrogenase / fumarate reductase cytochrome b subunit